MNKKILVTGASGHLGGMLFNSLSAIGYKNLIGTDLKKKNINTHKKKSINFNDFYNSYFINKNYYLPFIDAKIALSKDYYSINKKKARFFRAFFMLFFCIFDNLFNNKNI